MRTVLASLCFAGALWAQAGQPTKDDLNRMLEDLRGAIRREDWSEASRISIRINSALLIRNRSQATPSLELQHLMMIAGSDPIKRNPFLPRLVKAAFAAGDYARAAGYADEALNAAKHGVFWWTGDAIHQAYIVLGRLALRKGDVEEAKRALVAAGKTPGSSSLAGPGPNMQLAKDLLDRGETATVVQYLEECRNFWEGNHGKLAEWIVLIKAGLKPDFGPNVNY
jgi:tetratricopeptide (TPR) repeat protein